MKEQIIKIDEEYRIETDTENYILKRKGFNKKKQITVWRLVGYFPDLVSLCEEYINVSPRGGTKATGDVKDLIKAIKQAENTIKNLKL